ncbi:hypothetical protein [Cyanobium sp. NIES-981]|uniref:hypothetical protein n=1 Tax=Cyanobium sp. NIES-981 TaxID=1851505 RepID=UPI000B3535A7|nr:hypothetical protein [Cyanobium sp. NIES-981]
MPLSDDQQQRLDAVLNQAADLAGELSGQPEQLLDLLRQVEQLHRTIQDGPFRSSLPADRNHLFSLLRRMEQSGGWPYIPRLQLRTFMDLLQRDTGCEPAVPCQEPDHADDGPDQPLAA